MIYILGHGKLQMSLPLKYTLTADHGYVGEFSIKAGFRVSIQLILYDPYWCEWRKAIFGKEKESSYLMKTFPEENTCVCHNLDGVIKKNYKSTFQISSLPSLPYSSKEEKKNTRKILLSNMAIMSWSLVQLVLKLGKG